MKISYNWLKWYVPDAPAAEKLAEIFNYHLCEVETVEKHGESDFILDLKILPNRAHDLLSHQGVAREVASLLNIKYVDPTEKYKIPPSASSGQAPLKIDIKTPFCRRYMGRIVRNVKVGPSPAWVVEHLASIGQRSINNVVDAANIVMFDCGQPLHAFDLDKISGGIVVRDAVDGEELTTLDNKAIKFKTSNVVIADAKNALAIAGIKGGKVAEVDINTKNIILECANFDPTSVRKTAQVLNIFTDARKRFENDLSPELAAYAMRELSATILEMCPEATFEDIVDVYPQKPSERTLSFSVDRVSKILGVKVSIGEVEDILKRYLLEYKENAGTFEIKVPPMRLDLVIEEDMAEEVVRVIGYDKVKGNVPKMSFVPKVNETRAKIMAARSKLLADGYSEVMTYTFCNKGEVEVQNSASDKKFLRTNLSDGMKESLKLNQLNAPFLGIDKVKIFEIGTVFKKSGEELHVAYADKKEVKEMILDQFSDLLKNSPAFALGDVGQGTHGSLNSLVNPSFTMWSLFPFIARDVAVWVPEQVTSAEVLKVVKENAGDLVIKGPDLFDEFKKPASPAGGDAKVSYAFRIVFQSFDRTLTDTEINEIMNKITGKIVANGWQVR